MMQSRSIDGMVRRRRARAAGRRAAGALATALVLLLADAALVSAESCDSVTFQRPRDKRIGTCFSGGASCSNDSQCNANSFDFCLHGISASNSAQVCHAEGSSSCLEDITFHFDRSYECGQFANGDWWVQAQGGGVTLTSITPDNTPACEGGSGICMHGWEVDQRPEHQALTSRTGYFYDTGGTPSLPHRVQVSSQPKVVLKIIDAKLQTDLDGCSREPCMMHAAALTVVPTAPPSDAFRPPYAGPDKPTRYFRASEVDTSALPRLSAAGKGLKSVPSIEDVSRAFSQPWIGENHRNSLQRRYIPLYPSYLTGPGEANGYHAARSGRVNDALLRLTLSDFDPVGNSNHRLALYRVIQMGIDQAWISKNWVQGTRIRIKNKLIPIAFAAFMLNASEIRQSDFPGHSEEDTIYQSPKNSSGTGKFLWGYHNSEDQFWDMATGSSSANKWTGDPYGYTDQNWFYAGGGGGAYQFCCSSLPWKGGALVARLIEMESMLDAEPFLEYTDRWVAFGYHMSPDPCAKHDPRDSGCRPSTGNCDHYGANCSSGDCTWGPAAGNSASCHLTGSCECIGHGGDPYSDGRLNSYHGTQANKGTWGRSFTNSMWDAFRGCAEDPSCVSETPPPPPPAPSAPEAPVLLD